MGRVKILRASAGSGKTYRLAYEYIKAVVKDPYCYSSILAVTFTNKATEEMKSRILNQLDNLVKGESSYMNDLLSQTSLPRDQIMTNARLARSLILHDYSHFAISTIDKFFQTIIRGFIKELGLDFGYTVELNDDAYLGEAVDRLLERAMESPKIRYLTERVLEDNVENSKDWDIRPELISLAGELRKESYVQTEKEPEELIREYERLSTLIDERHQRVVASAQAALAFFASQQLDPTDFKGSSRSFALLFRRLAEGDIEGVTMDRIRRAAESPEEWYSKTSAKRSQIKSVSSQLMQLAREVVDAYDPFEKDFYSFKLLSENFNRNLLLQFISKELQQLWAERNRLPIHQTSHLIGRLVENTSVPFIYEKAGNRFDHYMIDEFQDTSTRQWQNFTPLLDDARSKSEDQAVMLIGDVKQAIYRWRGGDWDILARKAIDYFGDDADYSEQLRVNWRSLNNIIEFNNHLLREIVDSVDDPLLSEVYKDFEQNAPSKDREGGFVKVAGIESENFAETILQTVEGLLARGYSQRDIALLVYTGREGREVSEILLGGGYKIINQESLLINNSHDVKIVLSILRYALNREDQVSLAHYNQLMEFEFNQPFDNSKLLDELLLMTPLEALNRLIVEPSLNLGRASDQASYLQALYQVVINYSNDYSSDLAQFIEWWEVNGNKQSVYLPLSGDAITISTIHKSKGLQFPCVIIPRCEWQIETSSIGYNRTRLWANSKDLDFAPFNPAPIYYKKEMALSHYSDDYEHEKVYSLIDAVNMLYVAATRAERELYIYHTKQRGKRIYDLMEKASMSEAEYGEPTHSNIAPVVESGQITFESFDIIPSTQRIRTSWDSQRYYGNGQRIETPIAYGVLMHKIFSQIAHIDDIESSINHLVVSGEITAERASELEKRIKHELSDPIVAEWFNPRWKLFNERSILIPKSSAIRRPDRVIVNGARAIVIDYKFGEKQLSAYQNQINEYKNLLRQMGYSDISGYLWYVELGEIIKV